MLSSSVSSETSGADGLAVLIGNRVFNNAEESLQDGSHLFSTQHPVANTSVAVPWCH